jgi:Protein of unknown function (DUF1552)
MRKIFSRRNLLRALSAGVIPGGLAPRARPVQAQETARPLRLVCFPMLNGAPTKGTYENIGPNMFWPENFSALSRITDPLLAYSARLTFVRGLWIDGANNHQAIRSLFSGAVVDNYDVPADVKLPSIDQVVARHLQSGPLRTKLDSLHLAASPADFIHLYKSGRSNFFFAESGALDYEANPVKAFDTLFGDAASVGPPPAAADGSLRKQSLDLLVAENDELAASLIASPTEAVKLHDYSAALVKLRDATGATTSTQCTPFPIPVVERLRPSLGKGADGLYQDENAYLADLYPDIVAAQFSIMAHALNCGLTRVATLQASDADNGRGAVAPVRAPDGNLYAHHTASHMDLTYFGEYQRWYSQMLADFLRQLDVPDPLGTGETVLDNTVVLWLAECHPADHGSWRLPCAYLGNAGGKLKTGTIVNLDPTDYHNLTAAPSNKMLLRSVCRAFGVPDEASPHFGPTRITELEA